MLLRTASVFVTFSLAYVFLSPSTGPVDDKLAFHRRLLQQEDPEESLASDGATQMSGTTVSEETISSSSAEDSSSANSTTEDDPLFPPDLFTEQQRKHGAVTLHIIGIIYMFYALALVCDEFFVPSLDVITERLGISPDVAGATFMAAGGSAPELFTSIIGVFIAKSDVGIGTIVGSAVFNILFVIAACAFAASKPLSLSAWPLIRDVFFYSVSLLVLVVFFYDEVIYWWEALILFLWYGAYVTFMKFNETTEDKLRAIFRLDAINREGLDRGVTIRKAGNRKGLYHLMNETINPGILSIMIGHQQAAAGITGLKTTLQPPGLEGEAGFEAQENGKEMNDVEMAPKVTNPEAQASTPGDQEPTEDKSEDPDKKENDEENEDEEEPIDMSFPLKGGWQKIVLYLVSFPIMAPLYVTLPDTKDKSKRKFFVITFVGSIVWIAAYSYLMVWWATVAGDTIGIPPEIMGLTFLAAGTSVPDLITSVLVAKQGKGDMAVSSSVGSNIFDVTVGLPVPWLLWTIVNYPQGVLVSAAGVGCSVLLLFLMLVAVFLSIMVFNWKMTKGMGVVMGCLYFVFVIVSLALTWGWFECFI